MKLASSCLFLGVPTLALASLAHAGVVDFATGGEHNCIINDCSTAWCWGGYNQYFGEADDYGPPATGPQKAFEVAVGMDHSCVLWRDSLSTPGYVQCWGRDDWGQTSVPEGTYRRIDGGWMHTCAIDFANYRAECWGSDKFGESSDEPIGVEFAQISAGTQLSCGITRRVQGSSTIVGEELFCWGDAAAGVDYIHASELPNAANGERFSKVVAGGVHVCALSSLGRVYCWGENLAEQVTPLFEHDPKLPYAIEHVLEGGESIFQHVGRDYIDVSVSDWSTCGVYDEWGTGDRRIGCWGYPFSFDMAIWPGDADHLPLPAGFEPERVELSLHQACAEDDDTQTLECWSIDFENEMGKIDQSEIAMCL